MPSSRTAGRSNVAISLLIAAGLMLLALALSATGSPGTSGTPAAPASGKALGTLTVKGRTTVLKHVVASREADPDDSGRFWLVLLASNVPVAKADRSPTRLAELAAAGKLSAVRILWAEGFDRVEAVPYSAGLETSGHRGAERPTLDLRALDENRVDAEFRSKMLGQAWHFHASVAAPIVKGGTLELEPEAEVAAPAAPAPDASSSTRKKLALGKLGYEFAPENFRHAITDGNLEAVRLFLDLGTSPNMKDPAAGSVLVLSAMSCTQEPKDARGAVVKALLNAGANVKSADENGSTALLWAVQSCSVDVVRALVAAGSDVNARARGGATPLMMAEVFKRDDVAAALKKAGAKK